MKDRYRQFKEWQQGLPNFVNRHEGEVRKCHNCGNEFEGKIIIIIVLFFIFNVYDIEYDANIIEGYIYILSIAAVVTVVALVVTHRINKRTYRKNKEHA